MEFEEMPHLNLDESVTESEYFRPLNRSSLVFYFNEVFTDWYKKYGDKTVEVKDILERPFIYFIPPCENDEEAIRFLNDHCLDIFESILYEVVAPDTPETVVEAAVNEENFDFWLYFNVSHSNYDAASEYELGYEDEEA